MTLRKLERIVLESPYADARLEAVRLYDAGCAVPFSGGATPRHAIRGSAEVEQVPSLREKMQKALNAIESRAAAARTERAGIMRV